MRQKTDTYSSIYASLHMSTEDKLVYLDHMGHGDNVSKTNYQTPVGVHEVHVMGRMLNCIDSGKLDKTVDILGPVEHYRVIYQM